MKFGADTEKGSKNLDEGRTEKFPVLSSVYLPAQRARCIPLYAQRRGYSE